MDDDDERKVELDSIEAIFPELSRQGSFAATLDIPVSLAKPVKVSFPVTETTTSASASLYESLSFHRLQQQEAAQETHHFWNLPPLQLSIRLPDGYPSHLPPEVDLKVQERWLPEHMLEKLRAEVKILWEDLGRDLVVFSYIEYLQEAAEGCFSLPNNGILDLSPNLKVSFLDYDAKIKKLKFDNETFDCGVCLEPKKGAVCHRLRSCGHVFCVQCLQDFYSNCITEGDVKGIRCLDPICGKDQIHQADGTRRSRRPKKLQPSELLQIPITNDKVQRYVRLRKKRKLEADPNTVYCPRQWCQGAARIGDNATDIGDELSSESEAEDRAASESAQTFNQTTELRADVEDEEDLNASRPRLRPPSECLAVCTECSFAFCIVCKRSWHGELGFCAVRHEKLFSREEKASEEYLKKYTTPCPTCAARAQKIMGCNHMICRQCETHFCYLCSSWLDSSNPYSHFNTPGRVCYQRLWELEGGDGEGAPERMPPPPIEVIFEDNPPEDANEDNIRRQGRRAADRVAEGGVIPPPAPQPPDPVPGVRVRRRVREGLARPEPLAPNVPDNALRGHGLERFLELAQRDEEDEWDSDELEEHFIQFVVQDH